MAKLPEVFDRYLEIEDGDHLDMVIVDPPESSENGGEKDTTEPQPVDK